MFNENAIHMFVTNQKCKRYNYKKLHELECETNPVAIIVAEGKYRKQKDKSVGVGSVKQRVVLAKNCRVMLRSTLSVRHRLVNGSIGTVRKIIYYDRQPPSLPDYVLVEFDNYSGPTVIGTNLVPVAPVVQESETTGIASMKNLPLCLAYGRTVYKAQGSTLTNAVVDLGASERSLGVTYVALSRTRSLSSMRLFSFPRRRLTSIAENPELKWRKLEKQDFLAKNILHD